LLVPSSRHIGRLQGILGDCHGAYLDLLCAGSRAYVCPGVAASSATADVDAESAQAATEVTATTRLFDGLTVMQQRLHELRAVQGYITAEAEMAHIIARRRAELAALDERLAAVRVKVAEADACQSTK
jgi:hypothetical protein